MPVILVSFMISSTAFAKKVGCGVRVHDEFKLNKKIIEGKQYKNERTIFGNSIQDFKVIPYEQDAAYSIRYEMLHFKVRAIVENLKTSEIKNFDLGSIHPKNAVSGLIFSTEFNMPIEPIHFTDDTGKERVIKSISGKCKLQEFYIGDMFPIP